MISRLCHALAPSAPRGRGKAAARRGAAFPNFPPPPAMKRLALLLPLLALAAAPSRAENPATNAPAAGTAAPAYPFAADGSPADVIQIRAGDTLSGIAKALGVPVSRLIEMNDIADPSRIRAGDSLFIPFNSRIPPERRDPADPPANTDFSAFSFAKTIGADALHYWEWGAPWNRVEEMELVFAEHRVKIDCYRNGNDYGAKTNATLRHDHVCTDEEWRNILLRLNTARFDNWKESYSSPVCDGTKWRIDFLSGTNVVRSFRGANNWPFLFEQFVEVKKFAMHLPPAAPASHADSAEGAKEPAP